MKKTILSIALVAVISITSVFLFTQKASAQYGTIGATVGAAMPMGNFGDAAGIGFGVTASGRYFFNDNFAVGLNVGFNSFGAKNSDGLSESVIPVTVTGECFAGDNKLKPYFGLDFGPAFLSVKETINIPRLGSESASASETGIFISPTIGIKDALSDNLNLIINLKYNIISKDGMSGYLGINAGISYCFGKPQ